MSVQVGRQGLELLWAALLGFGLGALYDVGRALRRARQRLTLPVDAIFALIFFLGLWLTSVYTRGLRLYQCLGVCLGACAYFLTLSPILLRLWGGLLRKIGALMRRIRRSAKKSVYFLRKVAKKLFPTPVKWVKIKAVPHALFRGRP